MCVALEPNLTNQYATLHSTGTFDYMIIEASGVSEPSEIAAVFADCEDQVGTNRIVVSVNLSCLLSYQTLFLFLVR
jgi:G3E family GTPase